MGEGGGPESSRKACQIRGSEGGGLGHGRTDDRHTEYVSLKLHEAVVGGGSAIDAQFRYRIARVETHRVEQIGDLIGNALDGCTGQVTDGRAASETKDRAARVGISVRRAESNEG